MDVVVSRAVGVATIGVNAFEDRWLDDAFPTAEV